MARKATRGAGYDWGLADEAGAATRWLCARGLDGCAVLAELLQLVERQALGELRPVIDGAHWRGAAGQLCPIQAGAALSDRAALLDDAHPTLLLQDVLCPLLLLPFAARVARRVDAPIAVEADGTTYAIAADLLDPPVALPAPARDLHVSRGHFEPLDRPASARAQPDPMAWDVLDRFAHRTYAPATEASRRKGAGGDLPDRD